MKLLDLEPQFVRIDGPKRHRYVDTIGEAQGVQFLCPTCFAANGGAVGTHYVLCWNPSVPLSEDEPGPGRWDLVGTGLHDLTLRAGSSSVALRGGCNAHFFIRDGEIVPA